MAATFVRSKLCNKEKSYHISHSTCCNENEWVNWISDICQPLDNFFKANPMPNFSRVRKCDPSITHHLCHSQCCNREEFKLYQQWRDSIIWPFLERVFIYFPDIDFRRLQRRYYEEANKSD